MFNALFKIGPDYEDEFTAGDEGNLADGSMLKEIREDQAAKRRELAKRELAQLINSTEQLKRSTIQAIRHARANISNNKKRLDRIDLAIKHGEETDEWNPLGHVMGYLLMEQKDLPEGLRD